MPPRLRTIHPQLGRKVVDTTAITLANRARCATAALGQLARCEAMLRAEPKRVPRFRRCDVCQGLEDTTDPHQHAA